MEQEQDQGPPEDHGKGDSEAGSEVSMDEILTSLRSILEEDQEESAGAASGLTGTDSGDSAAAGGEDPPEDDGGDELVLTDVVEEGSPDPDPSREEDFEAPGAQEATAFEPLFTRDDHLGAGDTGQATAADEPTPTSEAPFRIESEEEDEPTKEGSEPGAPFPFGPGWGSSTESKGDPESPKAGPESEPDWGVSWSEEANDSEPSPFTGTQPDTGGMDPSPVDLSPQAQEETSASQPGSGAEGSDGEAAAAGMDTERVREVVQDTVEAQVAQATEGLDSRLAEALEPKIREVLQEFLEQRLPALLQELAEAEIERIKRGE